MLFYMETIESLKNATTRSEQKQKQKYNAAISEPIATPVFGLNN